MTQTEPIRLSILGAECRSEAEDFLISTCRESFDEADLLIEMAGIDPSMCYALRQGPQLVGVHLAELKPMLAQIGPFSALNGRMGVQEIALAISPHVRGRGFGRLLSNASPDLAARRGYDYLWAKSYSPGISDGRRALIRQHSTWRTMVEPLAPDLQRSLARYASPQLARKWTQDVRQPRRLEGQLVIETTRDGLLLPWILASDDAYSLPPCSPRDRATLQLEGQIVATEAILDGNRVEGAQLDLAPADLAEAEEVVLRLR